MQTEFIVNGVEIKRPSSFKIERYNVTNLTRVASAKMQGDLIAKKRKFYFTYDAISSDELDKILGAIDSDTLFFSLSYIENNESKSATVYVGSIPTDLHHTGGLWVWKNVQFNLIEQ